MITIEQAVEAARNFVKRVNVEDELKQLRVEEIESSEDNERWFVTLGWVEPAARTIGFSGLTPATIEALPRVYRVFSVDAESGEVISMKMRDE